MPDRIQTLQGRLRAVHRGRAGGRQRYPADLRAEIVTVTRAGRGAGRSVRSLARDLGVSAPTLTRWLRRPRRGPLRQVMLAPSAMAAEGAPAPVLVTPHGARVEGLDLAGLVTVLRGLG